MTTDQVTSGGRLGAYLELLRLPNLFTAMADVAMGFLIVQQGPGVGESVLLPLADRWTLGLLLAASTLLYAAGVVLNDVFDVAVDAQERPWRPLPSGRVSLKAARTLGWALLVLGVAAAVAATVVAARLWLAPVAALLAGCIVLYDAWLKRTPLGPLGMGACRMLNVLLGMSLAAGPLRSEHWLVAGAIGVYVVGVTWFARTEAEQSSRWRLALGTAVMLLGVGLLACLPRWTDSVVPLLQLDPGRWHLLIGILAMLIGWRCLWAIVEPVPSWVQMAVRHCILSLVILDAVACYAFRGLGWAMTILLLLIPAIVFGRWFAAT